MNHTITAILLAGGSGSRMQTDLPKQFLPLADKPIAHYALEVLQTLPEIDEIIIVCDPLYRSYFPHKHIRFALPGKRRQDSVWNGLQAIKQPSDLIFIHDAARPFIDIPLSRRVIHAAAETGAAAAAMPVKCTIKETDESGLVIQTPDRSKLWEVQTPQVLKKELLKKGFEHAIDNGITVTDDVSLAELIDHPVQLILGSYRNIKITTQEDMETAALLLQEELASI